MKRPRIDKTISRCLPTSERSSLSCYREVIEAAFDGFCLLDAEGRILEVNDAYVKRSGYSGKELLTMNFRDLEAARDSGKAADHMENAVLNDVVIMDLTVRGRWGEKKQ